MQGGNPRRPDALAELRLGSEDLRRVVGAGIEMELRGHAGLHESSDEGDVLIAEEIHLPDVDEGGWKAREVLCTSRGGVCVGLDRKSVV